MTPEVHPIKPLEGHKQSRLLLRSQTGAIVAHPETDRLTVPCCAQLNAWRFATILDCITNVINPYLFNPGSIPYCGGPISPSDNLSIGIVNQMPQPAACLFHHL